MNMKKRDYVLERNQAMTTAVDFLDLYNKMIPAHFPQATTEVMRKFQLAHPALFKRGSEWSIERHRKHLMDWLSSGSHA